MHLSKLLPNTYSREFRRDHADVREMHRTIMSSFPDMPQNTTARHSQAVLWRLDPVHGGFVVYIQSSQTPDWTSLPPDYLTEAPQVRSLQPVLDAIAPGRRFAFRLVGNPTRTVPRHNNGKESKPDRNSHGMRVPRRKPEEQLEWLIRKGENHGFIIPSGRNGRPDVSPSPCPTLVGHKRPGDKGPITIDPVRFEGHLVVTDAGAFAKAIRSGVGHGKPYGCGLISLAPARGS